MKKALIIFAKQPIAGNVKTRLIPGLSAEDAAGLYRCMLGDIVAKAGTLHKIDPLLFYGGNAAAGPYFRDLFPGLRIFPQTGRDLGRRMEAAFTRAFAMGYHAAAIIGSDSPDLPADFIEQAFRLLEHPGAETVFGPTADGGYYLLAMKKLYPDLFHGIEWSTHKVLEQSTEKAGMLGLTVARLPAWHDVDTVSDLSRPELRDEANGAPLTRRFISRLLDGRKNPEVDVFPLP